MDQNTGNTLNAILAALGSSQLGFQPAALLGQQPLTAQRDQMYGIETVANFFQPNSVNSDTIASVGANQITSGSLTAVASLGTGAGTGSIKIDGQNQRITINDGNNDRIIIGFQSGGF